MTLPTELYTLDARGEPQPTNDFTYWSDWREDHHDDLQLARTVIEHPTDGRIVVLTVFTGRDHRTLGTAGNPVLWETLVFGGPPSAQGERDRYDSLQAAREGHAAIYDSINGRCAEDRQHSLVRFRRHM
jgi:hypothetical protein